MDFYFRKECNFVWHTNNLHGIWRENISSLLRRPKGSDEGSNSSFNSDKIFRYSSLLFCPLTRFLSDLMRKQKILKKRKNILQRHIKRPSARPRHPPINTPNQFQSHFIVITETKIFFREITNFNLWWSYKTTIFWCTCKISFPFYTVSKKHREKKVNNIIFWYFLIVVIT